MQFNAYKFSYLTRGLRKKEKNKKNKSLTLNNFIEIHYQNFRCKKLGR